MGSWNAVRTFNEYKQPGLLSCRGRARGTGRIEARKQGHCIQTDSSSAPPAPSTSTLPNLPRHLLNTAEKRKKCKREFLFYGCSFAYFAWTDWLLPVHTSVLLDSSHWNPLQSLRILISPNPMFIHANASWADHEYSYFRPYFPLKVPTFILSYLFLFIFIYDTNQLKIYNTDDEYF